LLKLLSEKNSVENKHELWFCAVSFRIQAIESSPDEIFYNFLYAVKLQKKIYNIVYFVVKKLKILEKL